MGAFDKGNNGATRDGVDITSGDIEGIVEELFAELKKGNATVQSRPRNYYEVVIPFDKLPEELKQAVCQ
jgi:hypothetical protein